MNRSLLFQKWTWAVLCLFLAGNAFSSTMTINSNKVFVLDGKKIFPIGFTMPPPPDGKTTSGKNGIAELSDAGANFLRTGAQRTGWNAETIQREKNYEAAAAKYGMHCLVYLHDLASIKPGLSAKKSEAKLRDIVNQFKNNPGFGAWKGADEPEWGKIPVENLSRARSVIRALDTHHPMILIQAPRGTIADLRAYNPTSDALGADIYPISEPAGGHSEFHTNTEISLVGDYTRKMMAVANGQQPVMMTLQIAWSGTTRPGKKLIMPTLAQERFMTYEAIINGARGLLDFGGNITNAMSPADAKLGWNWTFWNQVLRPVVSEIGEKSPLYPALVEPNSTLSIKCNTSDMEYCIRELGSEIFLLACKRNAGATDVTFTNLPTTARNNTVLFESRSAPQIQQGTFTDRFNQFDVHVYRFQRN